jgi:hypothetical protein
MRGNMWGCVSLRDPAGVVDFIRESNAEGLIRCPARDVGGG